MWLNDKLTASVSDFLQYSNEKKHFNGNIVFNQCNKLNIFRHNRILNCFRMFSVIEFRFQNFIVNHHCSQFLPNATTECHQMCADCEHSQNISVSRSKTINILIKSEHTEIPKKMNEKITFKWIKCMQCIAILEWCTLVHFWLSTIIITLRLHSPQTTNRTRENGNNRKNKE